MAENQPNDKDHTHPEHAEAVADAATPTEVPTHEHVDEHADELPAGQIWTPAEDPPPPPVADEPLEAVDAPEDADEGVSEFLEEAATSEDETEAVTEAGVDGQTAPTKVEKRARDTVMIVNDAPGDECRIAFARGRRLESYFAERAGAATNVGNIYKGRVTNVEAAIQAAFVDFGEGQNGFLHISDVHPKYFPGGDKAERVGHKIPRRERPPIQECLKKGQEVLVQVIKQGIGTKGPTVTSYLSIPGRLLVMMPDMDRVGVSRKVDDEHQRREMRRILDSLELPEGFGFILRTAGFDRSRTELQRDAAYLLRLWDAMKKRIDGVGAPAELYTESDVLIRTVREMVDETISDIVVDSEHAWTRVTAFLDVVFPKDAPEVRFYDRPAPVFNAFDLERQISDIYQRQVPLPSGGALVFDQTEALVAIDVNSGKSRSARDSETNAFETNKEAVDEICRQLRLRDMGGLVVCDLIDMRSPRHRREIEQRFRQNLKKDRAKSTVGPISEFGLVELTRQRMRPSVRKAHFSECPHCTGSGEVRMPDSTAAEALRRVLTLFGSDRIHRVEMVCSVRVASVLLSSRRDQLIEIERDSGKRIDVRISEAIAADRVDLYAYDDRGADVEIERLPSPPLPRLAELPVEPPEEPAEPRGDGEEPVESRPRRRRRRRKAQPADATAMLLSGAFDDLPEVADDEPSVLDQLRAKESRERAERKAREAEAKAAAGAEQIGDDAGQEAGEDSTTGDGERRGRKRRRRRGRNRDGQPRTDKARTTATAGEGDASPQDHAEGAEATSADAEDAAKGESTGGEGGTGDRKRRRRRRGGRGRRRESGAEAANPDGGPEAQGASSDRAGSSELGDGGRDGRRRGSRRSGTDAPGSGHEGGGSAPAPAAPATGESADGDAAKPKGVFRSLYGAALRRLNPGAARDALKKDS